MASADRDGASAGADGGARSSPGEVRRADARRNIAAIVAAGVSCLADNPDASVSDIARAAGVGRMTVYGHFPKRADLVEAAVARAVDQVEERLQAAERAPDPAQQLVELIDSSWPLVARQRNLLLAAQRELPAETIRRYHDRPMRRVRDILDRGRRDGVFRTDLPIEWLVAVFYGTVHTAAEEVAAGRLAERAAGDLLTATLLAAVRPPAEPGEQGGRRP